MDKRAAVQSRQFDNLDDMLHAVMALPETPYIPVDRNHLDLNKKGYKITMNAAGITNAKSKTPMLGTCGLKSCMGMAIYNVNNGTGGIAHLSQANNQELNLDPHSRTALEHLLASMRTSPEQKLEVRIVGPLDMKGYDNIFIKDVLKILNSVPNLSILSADFKGKPYPTDFGMDTRHWNQGLLNGSRSLQRPSYEEMGQDPDAMTKFQASLKHIVDITDMSPAPSYDAQGLFDARDMHRGIHRSAPVHTYIPHMPIVR